MDITSKSDYRIDIVLDDLTWEEACIKEIELIKLYGRINIGTGILSNLTDGGEGFVGMTFSDEHKSKLSNSKKGKKRSELVKKRLRDINIGKKLSDEHKLKISQSNKGKKLTDEHKEKLKLAKSLNKSYMSKEVIDICTGVVFSSINEASYSLNINPKTLSSMLTGQNPNRTNLRYV